VATAAAAQAAVLTLGSNGYGYHRDELYYRMLPRAWGYVDQPPLTPLLARLSTHLADQSWALRLPATLAAAASVVVLALVTRELGGGRGAQALTAWGYAFSTLPLMLGHLLLTSTVDLPLLLLVVLAMLRGVRGDRPAWVWGGVVVGVTTYNRLLVTVVVAGLVLGLLVLGPRQSLRSRWPWVGALAAMLVGLPNVVYQAAHDWPQLAMGQALADNNAADVRPQLPLLLVVMLGPPLVAVWVVGIAWLLRRERRGTWGFLVVGLAVLVVFTFVSGAQPHYPVHLLSVAFAAGCVPVAAWLAPRPVWRVGTVALLAANAALSVLLALPVVPLATVGATPLPEIGPLVGDQVGWPRYVDQVAAAYRSTSQPAPTAVITSNYGEAGAVARFGGALGLPQPVSGQNSLYELGGPPPGTRAVLVVGYQLEAVRDLFGSCDVVARLDNEVGVDNEEQGAPVAICRDPRKPWYAVWPRFRHLD
jgi:Dolichyl-phosphate-mannose-protein mannosyltransferase